MPSVSTHVLDAAAGGPMAGIEVTLHHADGRRAGGGRTDGAGRVPEVARDLPTGRYRLSWQLGGAVLAGVQITVDLADERHYHLPLLASPASAVAYLGA